MEAPEWDIFGRIEKLEKLKLSVDEISKLAVTTFLMFFTWLAMQKPSAARQLKDNLIAMLKKDLSTGTLNSLQEFMLELCDRVDKEQ